MNAMAGGGTILTFPTLVFLGMPAIMANATSTVALLPGAVASMAGYRREVSQNRGWLKTLFLPSLLGGTLGSVLLLRTPEKTFQLLAPVLILFATVLFMLRGLLARRFSSGGAADRGTVGPGRALLQFGVAVYGGYFGAGIGILMLALLGFLGLTDIHAMNGLKNFFGAVHQQRGRGVLRPPGGGLLAGGPDPRGGRDPRRLRRSEVRPGHRAGEGAGRGGRHRAAGDRAARLAAAPLGFESPSSTG